MNLTNGAVEYVFREIERIFIVVDVVSPEKRSQMMAGISGKNTKPEIFVRKILHRMGYRFRLHKKDLPGKPDIVLPRYKIVIFVQGCFWHGHENCHLFRLPKSRTEFWEAKIVGNKARDEKVLMELSQLGYPQPQQILPCVSSFCETELRITGSS